MRSLEKNKRTVYYANLVSQNLIENGDGFDTGEKSNIYSKPKPIKINVSASKGNIHHQPFGASDDYDRVLSSCELTLPFNENTVFWIDNQDITKAHDYCVSAIADSQNSVLYAVKKVDVSNGA